MVGVEDRDGESVVGRVRSGTFVQLVLDCVHATPARCVASGDILGWLARVWLASGTVSKVGLKFGDGVGHWGFGRGMGQKRSMKRTGSWAIRIAWAIIHTDLRFICLHAWGRRRESSLHNFIRVVPEFGAGARLSAKALNTGVTGDCKR